MHNIVRPLRPPVSMKQQSWLPIMHFVFHHFCIHTSHCQKQRACCRMHERQKLHLLEAQLRMHTTSRRTSMPLLCNKRTISLNSLHDHPELSKSWLRSGHGPHKNKNGLLSQQGQATEVSQQASLSQLLRCKTFQRSIEHTLEI